MSLSLPIVFSRTTSVTSESGDEREGHRMSIAVELKENMNGKSRKSLFRKKLKKVNFMSREIDVPL